jgi:hypothetical protein
VVALQILVEGCAKIGLNAVSTLQVGELGDRLGVGVATKLSDALGLCIQSLGGLGDKPARGATAEFHLRVKIGAAGIGFADQLIHGIEVKVQGDSILPLRLGCGDDVSGGDSGDHLGECGRLDIGEDGIGHMGIIHLVLLLLVGIQRDFAYLNGTAGLLGFKETLLFLCGEGTSFVSHDDYICLFVLFCFVLFCFVLFC